MSDPSTPSPVSPSRTAASPTPHVPLSSLARVYFRVYLRMLAVAVPATWLLAMITAMSFLRCTTIQGMITGLTASIVTAAVAGVLVVLTACGQLLAQKATGRPASADHASFITNASNALLLVLWAVMLYLQHQVGANLLFWGLFDIDEPWSLINPEVDGRWGPAFMWLVAATILTIVARALWPYLASLWFVTTCATAIGWFALMLVFTVSNDLINDRISIAALEGTITWWSERGEASALLILIAGVIGVIRIRSAWIAVKPPG